MEDKIMKLYSDDLELIQESLEGLHAIEIQRQKGLTADDEKDELESSVEKNHRIEKLLEKIV